MPITLEQPNISEAGWRKGSEPTGGQDLSGLERWTLRKRMSLTPPSLTTIRAAAEKGWQIKYFPDDSITFKLGEHEQTCLSNRHIHAFRMHL